MSPYAAFVKILSRRLLAEGLNTTQRKISHLESGDTEPSLDDLRLLCEFYGVSADYLLGLPKGLAYPER